MKKTLFILIFLFLPVFALAKGEFWKDESYKGQTITATGQITSVSPLKVSFVDPFGEKQILDASRASLPTGPTRVGQYATFQINFDTKTVTKITKYSKTPDASAQVGAGSKSGYSSKLFPGTYCSGTTTLNCWLRRVFDWASVILASAAVIAIMAGGIMYMTSGGNPDQLGKAKKIMFNALAGVAILVLARLFMTKILGAPWSL